MHSGELVLMLLATGLLWLGGLVIPFVLAAHGRNEFAAVAGSVQLGLPLVFGFFGLALIQTDTARVAPDWYGWAGSRALLFGWAIGVYWATGLTLVGVAALLWPGPKERSLER